MPERIDRITDLARQLAPTMVELRRAIHAHPETGWREHATTARVAAALRRAGLEPAIRPGGVGATVDAGIEGPKVGFRCDLDALPIDEHTTTTYRSTVPGVMHACGHDVHTAVAVGIAAVLHRIDDLAGKVRVIFQPAEEQIPGGATVLRTEAVHEGLSALIAFHVDPSLAPGSIGARVGAITSASDRMSITLHGPGGHTSRPHQTVDLVNVAGKVITELPQMVRADIDPRSPFVVVFGRISGGSAENVIPTEIELGGTVRVFDAALWRELPKTVEDVIAAIVNPLGAEFELDYVQGSPPVVNDPVVAEIFAKAARSAIGTHRVEHTHQSLGSEDLAWFLQDVTGAMFRLGAAPAYRTVDLHSSTFDVDESCIETGIVVGAAAVAALLDHYA
ncbi:MAG: amidohydrolase [Acidimicrobiia bacterium]